METKRFPRVIFYITVVVGSFNVFAQCDTNTAGAWSTGSNWSCNHVPGSGENAMIDLAMTEGSLVRQWITQKITITTGGSLTITGDLTIQGNAVELEVNGGSLSVSGTLNILNGGKVTLTSGSISAANITMQDNTATFSRSGGSLSLTGTGNLTVNAGCVFTYAPNLNIPGTVTLRHGGTVYASGVGGGIALYSASKLNITSAGTVSPTSLSLNDANTALTFAGGTFGMSSTALTIPANIAFNLTSGTANFQSLTVSGTFNVTSGSLGLTSALTINSGSTFTYPGNVNVPGNITVANGATINASNVGGSISLSNSSKLILTTSGTVSPTGITLSDAKQRIYVCRWYTWNEHD